jgi:cytochrome c
MTAESLSYGMQDRLLRAALLAATVSLVACAPDTGEDRGAERTGARTTLPADVHAAPARPARFAIGRTATDAEIRAWDRDVGPDGRDLPAGRGTYTQGAATYAQKCASCHGARGEGMGTGHAGFPRIIGRDPREGFPFGVDARHVKTVGNYWPYATTVFDYVRRAMPLTAPGSLTDDETYALVAFLLAENEIVGRDVVMDAQALRQVRMPARDRFVRDDRRGGTEFR